MIKTKVGIIGAGLTGLVAAKELNKKGFQVSIFEKLNQAGGRMRTETIDGWNLDVGFQVLLTSYPYLKKHIDLSKINLLNLESAATIFRNGKTTEVGDPFRTKNILWKTIFSDIGGFGDKKLIYKLKKQVDGQSISEIFKTESISTFEFLNEYGFSETIIDRFFKPFFGGIFLENDLSTSSRMFLFTFKMFASGKAKIPKNGIGTIAQQIVSKLERVNFHFESEVVKIEDQTIYLKNGESESFDYVINTIPNYQNRKDSGQWQECYNLYFEHKSPAIISQPRIGLNANPDRLINNIFYPSIHQNLKMHKGKSLISITVLNSQGLSEKDLAKKVEKELESDFNIPEPRLVKLYYIPYSLPINKQPKNYVAFDYSAKTFEVGDFLLNGSQNAACKIGGLISKHILEVKEL
ncbi:FAD-dependent oxidoreductase [Brumimicrobium mesophilum]|uniref:FAD-dependent oxidoreductase n=1 Tax=Brumimicrobium mesophilum TaxID=392717 RepID=UPI000D1401BA|nr:FAD-dependent oxidoreductase [Brumimicrobium mesophilum]